MKGRGMSNRARRFKLAAGLMLLGGVLAFSGCAADLTLADGGKTEYKIVSADNASELDALAASDLAATLEEITGADFSAADGKRKSIFVGVKPECDKEPLRPFERRITTHDGNIYLYGEGERGNSNAVYDFLRDELGCRWYNHSGDKRIPKQSKPVIGELRRSIVPSIPCLTGSWIRDNQQCLRDFARRNAIVDELDNFIDTYRLHAGQRIVPSGLIPVGGNIRNTPGPREYLADKAYFKEHPEFFSMDETGKRVVTMQLCYSNMAMRDEFERNLEIMLKVMQYKGGRKLLGIGQDDNGGPFCCCPGCKELEKKYDHPAGPYYDFVLDMSKRFAKKHPEILLTFLAYREVQTLYPAKCLKKLPANLLPSYAPLECDFTKPLDHPVNAIQIKSFKEWADIAEQLHWWAYPTTYPRFNNAFPLVANIRRIAENFRLGHQLKVLYAFCQFGAKTDNCFGFNDMRPFILAELCRDITLDENKLVAEYAHACYGKAAAPMLKYIDELEKLEAETNFYLRWNPDVLHLPYTTGANLVRWERDFDAMEALVSGDAHTLLNIRRARYTLDQTLLGKWPFLTDAERKAVGGLDRVVARIEQTIVDDQSDFFRADPSSKEKQKRLAWYHEGLDPIIALARGGKPLPPELAERNAVRMLPRRNKSGLDKDPDTPFGFSAKLDFPEGKECFFIRSHEPARDPRWASVPMPQRFGPEEWRDRLDGKYRYLHLGRMPVGHADSLLICGSRGSLRTNFCLTPLFDPKRPKRLYDFHVLIAFAPDKSHIKIAEVVAIPTDEDAKDEKPQKRDAARDNFDALV